MTKANPKLKAALVKGLINHHRTKKGGGPVNLNAKTLALISALAEKLMRESIRRSIDLCRQNGDSSVSLEHFQRVLPQLLLDFSV
ncbi:hypothetical protein PMAYCL1PPCAC_17839 [Pristionchus mayeri]|uniref:Centromere protein X n=1 Tax=Pristionchus mayeri TaxID=1317129 RepID=A0AAN5CNG7_9BILA|nr:hypothetical protein PMAYCL1PPCAC_17839 [Pristionchus mayeri]